MGSQRRAVRVLVNGNYPCVCNTAGHEVHSASLPRTSCLGTKSQGDPQWLLVALFRTV